MPPFNQFTTKAKEAIRKAHELAIERGQNHVSPLHLLTALILQEESIVPSILDRMNLDTIFLTDTILDEIEGTEAGQTLSASYQIYLTPELAQVIEMSSKVATEMHDNFVSTEHLFISCIEVPSVARDILLKFKIDKVSVLSALSEIKNSKQIGRASCRERV